MRLAMLETETGLAEAVQEERHAQMAMHTAVELDQRAETAAMTTAKAAGTTFNDVTHRAALLAAQHQRGTSQEVERAAAALNAAVEARKVAAGLTEDMVLHFEAEFNAMKRKELHAMLGLIFSLNGRAAKSCAFITKVTRITFTKRNLPTDLGGPSLVGGVWNILTNTMNNNSTTSKESKRDAIRRAYMECFSADRTFLY